MRTLSNDGRRSGAIVSAGRDAKSLRSLTLILTALVFCLTLVGGHAQSRSQTIGETVPHTYSADKRFRETIGRFIDSEMRLYPQRATAAGDHRFDGRVNDLSRGGIARRILHATSWKRQFESFAPDQLSPHNRADREWLIAQTDAELLWNQQLRTFERAPGIYLPTSAVYSLIKRNFAPASVRMRSVTARETAALNNLHAARANLTSGRTPPVSIRIVLSEMPGTLSFFKTDLPKAFASVPDGPDKSAFRAANARLVAAIEDYDRWLRTDLLPKAHGNSAIGTSAYRRMLADEDMVRVSPARLDRIGERELKRLQTQFRETAHRIDPKHSAAKVAASINSDHPAADQVIPQVKAGLAALRNFVTKHRIVTIPAAPKLMVRESPPFMRATSFASIDLPGPFEKSLETYFYVTLPDPSWPEKRREQLLSFFSPPLISVISVHEVYPGHYVQFMTNRHNPDPVRSLYTSSADTEGWAFYCEQMMIDEGLHRGQPRYRLAMLQLALLRVCRYLVAIRMHTQGMTIAQAAAFFEHNAYMTPHNAMVEARRGSQDPGYLSYELGKLMILKLRSDMRKKEGAAFSLEKFHDEFLAQGAIPIPLIRRALLGKNEGAPL